MHKITKIRGVRGAASLCALAAILYLAVKYLLSLLGSLGMGLAVPGASMAEAVGFSDAVVEGFTLLIGVGAIAVPVAWLLHSTRLETPDLRLTIPSQWSPAFCLPVFLGVANGANLLGGVLTRLLGSQSSNVTLPAGGPGLGVYFLSLCLVPAITEELFFRGALQGLMRPCGSAAAVFAPALLFALLHMDLAQGITAFCCGIFLGWLAERTGSILPGMALHFANNAIAFVHIYLQLYAPANIALGVQLFVLFFFPVAALWLVFQARRQGFHFSAGMRPGVDALAVFTSPAYTAGVVFLAVFSVYQTGLMR